MYVCISVAVLAQVLRRAPRTVGDKHQFEDEGGDPAPKPVGLQVPDRAMGNKRKRLLSGAKGWTEGQLSASAASTEGFALVTAPYSTVIDLSSDEAPDAPPSLPLVTGYQAGGDGGGSQKGASSAGASSSSPPVTGASSDGAYFILVTERKVQSTTLAPTSGVVLTRKERIVLSKQEQMEKRDMCVCVNCA